MLVNSFFSASYIVSNKSVSCNLQAILVQHGHRNLNAHTGANNSDSLFWKMQIDITWTKETSLSPVVLTRDIILVSQLHEAVSHKYLGRFQIPFSTGD